MNQKAEFLQQFHSQSHIVPQFTNMDLVDAVFDAMEKNERHIVPWIDFAGRTGQTTLLIAIAKFVERKIIYVTCNSTMAKYHGLDGRSWLARDLRGHSPESFIIMDSPLTIRDIRSEYTMAAFNQCVTEIRSPGILVIS